MSIFVVPRSNLPFCPVISGSNDRTIRIHDFSIPEDDSEVEEEAIVC